MTSGLLLVTFVLFCGMHNGRHILFAVSYHCTLPSESVLSFETEVSIAFSYVQRVTSST
jgi:hypothetical protein